MPKKGSNLGLKPTEREFKPAALIKKSKKKAMSFQKNKTELQMKIDLYQKLRSQNSTEYDLKM